jgi:hypothetical protein
LGSAALLASTHAQAFCRTTTCDPAVDDCNPPDGEECTSVGVPAFWPGRCVGFNVQQDAAPRIPLETFRDLTVRSFAKWANADCGGGVVPTIEVHDLGPVPCHAIEYNQCAGNANILMFRSDSWPYPSSSALALTTVTFNMQNGEIYDVDMEINNTVPLGLPDGDEAPDYDLESILTHEIGHFLGLAHSGSNAATMYPVYGLNTIHMRSLEADDIAGICAAYPSDRVASACDPTPRHGFQSTCGEGTCPKSEKGGCAIGTTGARGTSWAWLVGLVATAAWAARLRRNHR